jgi:hypothetical protein
MNPRSISHPRPTHDAWVLVANVRPSTDAEEYCNAESGTGPPNDGGTVIGIDVDNPPLCSPPAHEYDGANDVFRKSPVDDDGPAANANTAAASPPGTSTPSTDTTPADSTFDAPATGVCTRHSARSGVANTHDGNDTNRNRPPKLPPNMSLNPV